MWAYFQQMDWITKEIIEMFDIFKEDKDSGLKNNVLDRSFHDKCCDTLHEDVGRISSPISVTGNINSNEENKPRSKQSLETAKDLSSYFFMDLNHRENDSLFCKPEYEDSSVRLENSSAAQDVAPYPVQSSEKKFWTLPESNRPTTPQSSNKRKRTQDSGTHKKRIALKERLLRSYKNILNNKRKGQNYESKTFLNEQNKTETFFGRGVATGTYISTLLKDSDKKLVSPFEYGVVSQLECAELLSSDRKGNRSSVNLGFKGIACCHCKGANSRTGRYFPASLKTLSDPDKMLYTIYKHLMRCSECPANVKVDLEKLLGAHKETTKALRHGSKTVFYRRIWNTLHPSNEAYVSKKRKTHA